MFEKAIASAAAFGIVQCVWKAQTNFTIIKTPNFKGMQSIFAIAAKLDPWLRSPCAHLDNWFYRISFLLKMHLFAVSRVSVNWISRPQKSAVRKALELVELSRLEGAIMWESTFSEMS